MSAPAWVTRLRRAVQRRPGLTADLICPACGRSVYPKDWARDTCRDCHIERGQAFADWDGGPFLPSEEEE